MAENVKGLNIEIGLDTTQLERGLSNVKSDLKANSQELKKVNKNMKFDINPLNSMQKKFDLLKQRIKLLNEQLSKEKNILAQMKDASEKGLIPESKLQKQVLQVQRLNDELETTSMEAKKVEHDMGQMSQKGSQNVGQMASNIKSKVAIVVAAIAAVIKTATSAVTTASDIREEANEAGVAMEAFQRLATAGQLLGVSQNSVKKSLLEVNGVLSDIAGHNSTEATKTLEKLGLNLQELSEMGTEGAFYEIINALNQVEDKNQKLNYATQIFGQRYATAILPMIEKGSEAVKDLADNAEGIWTEEQADVSADIANTMGDIKNDFLILVADILPYLKDFFERLHTLLTGKLAPLIQKLMNFLGETLSNVIDALEIIFEKLEPILTLLSPLLEVIDRIAKILNKLLEHDILLNLLSKLADFLDKVFGLKEDGNNGSKLPTPSLSEGIPAPGYEDDMVNGDAWYDNLGHWHPGVRARNNAQASTGGNTYNVTIYTTASHFSIDEIDEEIGRQI